MTIGRNDIAQRITAPRALEVRLANDRIAAKAERLRFVSRVPMLCECGDLDCRAVVMIALEDYHAIRREVDAVLTAPGHSVDARRADDERRSA